MNQRMQLKTIFKTLLLVSIAIGFGTTFHASDWHKDKLKQYFDQLIKHDKANLSLSILKDDEVIYQRTIGQLSEAGENANPDSLYRIGSITKMYTATIIMQLIEAGKLSLDTPLSKFYYKVKNSPKITIKHLLSHSSGIHNFTDMPEYQDYMTEPKTKQEMLTIIYNMASDYEPGSQASYSNSNYLLLGFIIEMLDKSSYAESLQNRILIPLKLKQTVYGSKIDVDKNQAASMMFQQGRWQNMPETDMTIPHAAGAIVATSADVAKFVQALFSGMLVSEDSLDKMMDIQNGYGLGVLRLPFYDRFAYGHTGGIDGFSTITGHFPQENMTFAMHSNAMKMNLNDVTVTLLSAYFKRSFEMPDFNIKTVYLSPPELEVFAGNYGSKALPIDITLFVEDQTLFAQGSGQAPFPLTAINKQHFRFEKAGIEIEFNDKRADSQAVQFVMRQGGGSFPFVRKD